MNGTGLDQTTHQSQNNKTLRPTGCLESRKDSSAALYNIIYPVYSINLDRDLKKTNKQTNKQKRKKQK